MDGVVMGAFIPGWRTLAEWWRMEASLPGANIMLPASGRFSIGPLNFVLTFHYFGISCFGVFSTWVLGDMARALHVPSLPDHSRERTRWPGEFESGDQH